jgi:hypothetical protein
MRRHILSIASVALLLAPWACGGSGNDDNNQGDGGMKPDGSVVSDMDGNVMFDDAPINTDSGLGGCATDTQKAELLPLDLYIMQDTSGSMYNLIAQNTSKYSAVKSALTTFFNDPGSKGIGVGLQFFPVNKAGEPNSCTSSQQCTGGSQDFCLLKMCVGLNPKSVPVPCNSKTDCAPNESCVSVGTCANNPNVLCIPNTNCGNDANGFALGNCSAALTTSTCTLADSCAASDYAKPAVPIGVLPGSAAGLIAALNAKSPNGNTPTSAALQGAIDQAKAYAMANPTHKVVAVFATDGMPTECDTNQNDINAIAQAGANGSPSIKTYVIGVFAQNEQSMAKPNLDAIAQAGGTNQAFIVTANSNTAQAFLAAMNQIRAASLPCEFFLPKPDGGIPDYDKVNVTFTAGNKNVTVVPYVGDPSKCDPQKGGWYYDVDPMKGTPTKVMLCPATCMMVKADSGGQVDIVQGCKTVTPN